MADSVTFPFPGCIVECMQANKPVPHWVLDVSGDTVRLLSPSRKESKLNASRLLPWLGPAYPADKSREEIEKLLKEHESARETLAGQVDVLEVWDTVKNDTPRTNAAFLAGLLWESPDADKIAAVGHAALACKTHFKFSPPDFEVYDEETAVRRAEEMELTREREALAGVGGEFFRNLWAYHTKTRGPLAANELPPEDLAKVCAHMLRDRIADPECPENADLWRLLTKSLPEDPFLALHLATAWGLVPRHHNFWLDRAGYAHTEEWADAFADELRELASRVQAASQETREITAGPSTGTGNAPFISVDPVNTADVDDAFAIHKNEDGTFAVSLAFACPARFWPFTSPLDKTVLRRASSLYLPEGDHHMIPRETGVTLFSLLEGERRPATVLEIALSPMGDVLSVTPRLTWVRLAANLTLPGAQAVLDGPNATVKVTAKQIVAAAPYATMLLEAQELAAILQRNRIADGAVITERPDAEITLEHPEEEGGEPAVSVCHAPETPSAQGLVGEFMILANAALATWANERGIPLIYRTQDVALPPEFAGVWTEPHDIARVVKQIPPSVLELTPKRHAGLGIPVYAPLTSPIRRYTDLINTGQVVSYLETGAARFSHEDLTQLLPVITSSHEAVAQVQRFRPRYWKLLFYKQMGDKMWWDAVVTDENDAFATLSLPLTQIAVRAKRKTMGEKTYPGERVKVRLGKIDPLRNEIRVLAAMET
ncbi:MAG: Ribonuclease R [Desulfovibrio sp.]